MAVRPTVMKAIAEYARAHRLTPQLSVAAENRWYFTDKTGKEIIVGQQDILNEYAEWKTQQRKEKK